jgi:hypothetical protein
VRGVIGFECIPEKPLTLALPQREREQIGGYSRVTSTCTFGCESIIAKISQAT